MPSSAAHSAHQLNSGELRIRSAKEDDLAWEALRLRQLLRIGLVCWLLFVGLDYLVVIRLDSAPFWFFVVCRALGAIVFLISMLVLSKWSGKLAVRVVDLTAFGLIALLISVMAIGVGGIRNPYFVGVIQALVIRATAMPAPWRKGLLLSGFPATMYPLTMLIASFFVPSVAEQFSDPDLATLFVVDLAGIYGCLFLVVLGSDAGWRLRRQLFEAKMIGRYRLSEKIGAGGMGEVWRAYDRSLKTDVALKFLQRNRVDERDVARFEREVRATCQLRHPNTIRVSDFGWTDEGYLYYAMEYLDGETLRDLVARKGPLSSAEALPLFRQIASALGEAHTMGLVHRDVKPGNVIVVTLGGVPDQVKLLDFGLVKMAEGSGTGLTATGWMGGTPSYMAPEVVMGLEADARADVYSLGATMYLVVTGQPPFATTSDVATLRAHIERPLVPPSERSAVGISADLEAVIVRCLEKAPEDRYESCVAVAAALASVDVATLAVGRSSEPASLPAGETLTLE